MSIACISRLGTEHMSVSEDVSTWVEGEPTNFRVPLNFFARRLTAVVGISECALPVLELLPQFEGLGWLWFRGGRHRGRK